MIVFTASMVLSAASREMYAFHFYHSVPFCQYDCHANVWTCHCGHVLCLVYGHCTNTNPCIRESSWYCTWLQCHVHVALKINDSWCYQPIRWLYLPACCMYMFHIIDWYHCVQKGAEHSWLAPTIKSPSSAIETSMEMLAVCTWQSLVSRATGCLQCLLSIPL